MGQYVHKAVCAWGSMCVYCTPACAQKYAELMYKLHNHGKAGRYSGVNNKQHTYTHTQGARHNMTFSHIIWYYHIILDNIFRIYPRLCTLVFFGSNELIGENPAWIGWEESCQMSKGKPAVYKKTGFNGVVRLSCLKNFFELLVVHCLRLPNKLENKTANVTAATGAAAQFYPKADTSSCTPADPCWPFGACPASWMAAQHQ
jgi:hypothetical protein